MAKFTEDQKKQALKEIEDAKKGRYTKESEDLDFSKSGNPKIQKSPDKKTPKKNK